MAREYYGIRMLQPIYGLSGTILVNRTGRDTAAVRATLRALRAGRVVGIFPEGGIHLDPESVGAAKPGAAMLALLARAPVIPAFIDRPLRTNRLWDGLTRRVRTRVRFGKPIDLRPYYGREHELEALDEVTRLLMAAIGGLRPVKNERTNPTHQS
jgi:1-acyl-sn-glycerol-3-phosphate acyltransferase